VNRKYKEKLQKKIEKGRQLVKEFKELGINATLDEKTGEVTVTGEELTKFNVQNK
jgi:hypothetical protein